MTLRDVFQITGFPLLEIVAAVTNEGKSLQFDGVVNEGNRGKSIWDTFSRLPGRILDFSDADVAVDQYHRFKIRRESAHGESVCCNNVRALFDELPMPHIIVESHSFLLDLWTSGPLTEWDYAKAEKVQKVLRYNFVNNWQLTL
ncbi:uncharacterized protein [Spinacia oleracea]|uniref:Uncharacterized protein n=1 Tax=Spinacia oleracea TaxID=3562 RepID=A0ABM3RIG5_SPIOL|nr:uncharacterized protein LOC110798726 [Spinacia oleracea]